MLLAGGTVAGALEVTESMYAITVGESSTFTLPALSMRGVPTGIDVERVAARGLTPQFHIEILHKQPGGGPIGVALWRPPSDPFDQAAQAGRQGHIT
jgi:hypothetical protein